MADQEGAERGFTVLVVDDQPSARRVLTVLLMRIPGIRVVEAGSLDEARAAITREPFDVALIDIRLEADVRDRSGLTLISELRSSTTTTPVVVTAAGEMAQIRAAMRLGAYDFILKEELGPELVIPMLEELRERRQLLCELATLRARS